MKCYELLSALWPWVKKNFVKSPACWISSLRIPMSFFRWFLSAIFDFQECMKSKCCPCRKSRFNNEERGQIDSSKTDLGEISFIRLLNYVAILQMYKCHGRWWVKNFNLRYVEDANGKGNRFDLSVKPCIYFSKRNCQVHEWSCQIRFFFAKSFCLLAGIAKKSNKRKLSNFRWLLICCFWNQILTITH